MSINVCPYKDDCCPDCLALGVNWYDMFDANPGLCCEHLDAAKTKEEDE